MNIYIFITLSVGREIEKNLEGTQGESYILTTSNYNDIAYENRLVGYEMERNTYTYRFTNTYNGQIILHFIDFDLHPNSTLKVSKFNL